MIFFNLLIFKFKINNSLSSSLAMLLVIDVLYFMREGDKMIITCLITDFLIVLFIDCIY